jgi:receptor-type tyrosine-protein phosphatase Q
MKSFIKNFTGYFKISPNYTRVSVIKYQSRIHVEFLFSKQFVSQQDLNSAIDDILYTGGGTNTGGALSKAYTDMFNVSYGARSSGWLSKTVC